MKLYLKKIIYKIVKIITKPILKFIREEFHEDIRAQEIFTSSRFEQIKEVQYKLAERQHFIEEQLSDYITFNITKAPFTLISNGLIDSKSYLQKTLNDSDFSYTELKADYDDGGLYFLFEKLFRGSESEIYQRQSYYLEYIQKTYQKINKTNDAYFLDFGSGRSEFLKVLKDSNIPAKGVDSSKLNSDIALKKGFSVINDDGLNYLNSIPDNSLYGITMFQVAEHIQYDPLKKIIKTAYNKIMPGGVLLIETVNPSCDYSMRYFYLDPTHIRPYPPETIKFLCEWEGFIESTLIFYQPVKTNYRQGDFTNYIGYAHICYKQ